MIVRAAARGPEELTLASSIGRSLMHGVTMMHQAFGIEFPVLVAVGAEPLAAVVVPFIGETHGDPIASEGPKLLDQPVIQFRAPICVSRTR